eukprot:5070028-Amphidinium_carterae.1
MNGLSKSTAYTPYPGARSKLSARPTVPLQPASARCYSPRRLSEGGLERPHSLASACVAYFPGMASRQATSWAPKRATRDDRLTTRRVPTARIPGVRAWRTSSATTVTVNTLLERATVKATSDLIEWMHYLER